MRAVTIYNAMVKAIAKWHLAGRSCRKTEVTAVGMKSPRPNESARIEFFQKKLGEAK
jgi:hypothetical protein